MLFSDIDISQGSVETHSRCGGIYNDAWLQISQTVCPWKNF